MGRLHRYDPDGGWHHTMNRGVDRINVFRDDVDRTEFLKQLVHAAKATDVSVGAYCLMGNHFHLLVHCPSGGLSTFMWMLSSRYGRRFNKRHNRDGPLYRSRFTSKLVTDERYLAHLLVYIHRNPIELGADPTLWKWSSLQAHVRPTASTWLATDELKGVIGSPQAHLQAVATHDPRALQSTPAETYDAWRVDDAQRSVEGFRRLVQEHGSHLLPGRQAMACAFVAQRQGFTVDLLAACSINTSTGTVRSRLRRSAECYRTDREFARVVDEVIAASELGYRSRAA